MISLSWRSEKVIRNLIETKFLPISYDYVFSSSTLVPKVDSSSTNMMHTFLIYFQLGLFTLGVQK